MRRVCLSCVVAVGLASCQTIAADLPAASQKRVANAAVRVIDGDTIKIGKRSVRAVGYDTPESSYRAKCAQEREIAERARVRVVELVSPPHLFTWRWAKGQDNYGRGRAYFYSDHKDIGPTLIAEGLARPYDGRTRPSWCN